MIKQVEGEKVNDGDSRIINESQNSIQKENPQQDQSIQHDQNTQKSKKSSSDQNTYQDQNTHQDQTIHQDQTLQQDQNVNQDMNVQQVKNVQHQNHRQLKQVWRIYLMALNACLGSLFFGYNLGVYNSAQKVISKLNDWDEDEFELYTALITSFMPLGALFGALFRIRKCMIIFDVISIIGTAVLIIDNIVPYLLLGRFICGFCVGINSAIIPIYIKDFTPIQITGKAGSFNQIIICFGIFCSYIISLVLPLPSETEDGYSDGGPWRIVLGLPMFAPALRILILLFIFRLEIPTVMMKDGRYQEVLSYFNQIYVSEKDAREVYHGYEEKANDELHQEQKNKKKQPNLGVINQECNNIISNPNEIVSMNILSMNVMSTNLHSANMLDLPEAQIKTQDVSRNGSAFKIEQQHAVLPAQVKSNIVKHQIKTQQDFYNEKIFELSNKETYWKRFILGCLIQFCTQCSGINAILFYSNSIFKETAGGTGAAAELIARRATIGLGAAMTIFTCPSICLLDRFGRRTLLLYGTGIVSISLFVFAGLQKIDKSDEINNFGIFIILLFQLGWQVSLGAVTWVLNSEILDIQGISFSYFLRWLSTMAVGLVFPYMKKDIDLFGSFLVFGCFTIVLLVYFIFQIKETQGKDRYEILKSYCNSKKYQEFEIIAKQYATQHFEEQKKLQDAI